MLYNSRAPRPGEVDGRDYHFRAAPEVEALREKAGFTVFDVRGDLQALDLQELTAHLAAGDVFFEGNPFVGGTLLALPALAHTPRLAAFLSRWPPRRFVIWSRAASHCRSSLPT